MQHKQHYIDKLSGLSTDELKDIIAGRFRIYSDVEVAAAIELLSIRRGEKLNSEALSVEDLDELNTADLIEIVKSEKDYNKELVDTASAIILKREHTAKAPKKETSVLKKMILGLGAVVGIVVVLKVLAAVSFLLFILYNLNACLHQ